MSINATLVATAKDEGPYLWEWVAHHRAIGFNNIIIFQNDSTDGTKLILRTMLRANLIQFYNNYAAKGRHQIRAYTLASQTPEYQASDWIMALDIDEFLVIKTPEGTLESLLELIPDREKILINWQRFGSSGQNKMQLGMVTDRYLFAERCETVTEQPVAFKTLFRRDAFARPGVHQPSGPKGDTPARVANGSGLDEADIWYKNYRSSDPAQCAFAQVNHYIVKDSASFVLKSHRGSAHQANREIGKAYWDRSNFNEAINTDALLHRAARLAAMNEIDDMTEGKLFEYSEQSMQHHFQQFVQLLKNQDTKELYQHCVENNAVDPVLAKVWVNLQDKISKPEASYAPLVLTQKCASLDSRRA